MDFKLFALLKSYVDKKIANSSSAIYIDVTEIVLNYNPDGTTGVDFSNEDFFAMYDALESKTKQIILYYIDPSSGVCYFNPSSTSIFSISDEKYIDIDCFGGFGDGASALYNFSFSRTGGTFAHASLNVVPLMNDSQNT